MKSKEEIRKFRNTLAGSHRKQPSAIFPDSSIDMLYELQPKSIEDLKGKPQFPANGMRIATYGDAIINFFNPPTKPEKTKSRTAKKKAVAPVSSHATDNL